jgi:hypothetical protein
MEKTKKSLIREPKHLLLQISKVAGADIKKADTKKKLVDKLLATPGIKVLIAAGLTGTAALGIYYKFVKTGIPPNLKDVRGEILSKKGSKSSKAEEAAKTVSLELSKCKTKMSNFSWHSLSDALGVNANQFEAGMFFKLPSKGKFLNCCVIEIKETEVIFDSWEGESQDIKRRTKSVQQIQQKWCDHTWSNDPDETLFAKYLEHTCVTLKENANCLSAIKNFKWSTLAKQVVNGVWEKNMIFKINSIEKRMLDDCCIVKIDNENIHFRRFKREQFSGVEILTKNEIIKEICGLQVENAAFAHLLNKQCKEITKQKK